VQETAQEPQWSGSFAVFTQSPLQQVRVVPQAGLQL
jgi:hypothetical protein